MLCVAFLLAACQEEFDQIEVDYLTMPGWNANTEHVRQFQDLPQSARDYVHKIEQLLDVKGTVILS